MIRFYTFLAVLFFCSTIFAQQQINRSPLQQFAVSATVVMREIHDDFNPQLQHLEMPAPGSESYRRHLIDLKSAYL